MNAKVIDGKSVAASVVEKVTMLISVLPEIRMASQVLARMVSKPTIDLRLFGMVSLDLFH